MKNKLKMLAVGFTFALSLACMMNSPSLIGIQNTYAQETDPDDESEVTITESCTVDGKYVSCTITGCLTGKIDCKPDEGCCP